MMSSSSTTTDADRIDPIHPGEVLMEDFIEGFRITQNKLATAIGAPRAASTRSCTASAASPRTPLYDWPSTSAHLPSSG